MNISIICLKQNGKYDVKTRFNKNFILESHKDHQQLKLIIMSIRKRVNCVFYCKEMVVWYEGCAEL